MRIRDLQIETFTVSAIIRGDKATLIDRHGCTIGHAERSQLGPLDDGAKEELAWQRAVNSMAGHFAFRQLAQINDPWLKKADTLASSFRLRQHDRPKRSDRQRLANFRTTTWPDAGIRMVEQAHNRFRRNGRSGWTLWSHTVSSNQNKRAEARYG
jgi:hypothetical protein